MYTEEVVLEEVENNHSRYKILNDESSSSSTTTKLYLIDTLSCASSSSTIATTSSLDDERQPLVVTDFDLGVRRGYYKGNLVQLKSPETGKSTVKNKSTYSNDCDFGYNDGDEEEEMHFLASPDASSISSSPNGGSLGGNSFRRKNQKFLNCIFPILLRKKLNAQCALVMMIFFVLFTIAYVPLLKNTQKRLGKALVFRSHKIPWPDLHDFARFRSGF